MQPLGDREDRGRLIARQSILRVELGGGRAHVDQRPRERAVILLGIGMQHRDSASPVATRHGNTRRFPDPLYPEPVKLCGPQRPHRRRADDPHPEMERMQDLLVPDRQVLAEFPIDDQDRRRPRALERR